MWSSDFCAQRFFSLLTTVSPYCSPVVYPSRSDSPSLSVKLMFLVFSLSLIQKPPMRLLPHGVPTSGHAVRGICTTCLIGCYEAPERLPAECRDRPHTEEGPCPPVLPLLDNPTHPFLRLPGHDSNSSQTGPLAVLATFLQGYTSVLLSLNLCWANPTMSGPKTCLWASPEQTSQSHQLGTSRSTFPGPYLLPALGMLAVFMGYFF